MFIHSPWFCCGVDQVQLFCNKHMQLSFLGEGKKGETDFRQSEKQYHKAKLNAFLINLTNPHHVVEHKNSIMVIQ